MLTTWFSKCYYPLSWPGIIGLETPERIIGRETPQPKDSSSRLHNLGLPVGAKTSRNRLVYLLDKYVRTKRPRLTRDHKASRIRSTHQVRPKPKEDDHDTHTAEPSTAHVLTDPFAPNYYNFNQLEHPDLIRIVEEIGLDGKTLPKDKLVVLCNQNRDISKSAFALFPMLTSKLTC